MNFETFILIGGRSSRFGRDKFSIEFNGESLVERITCIVREAFSKSEIVLVAASAEQVKGLNTATPVVFDFYTDRGPWGGLHAALTSATSEWVFILACDFPLLAAPLLQRLATMAADEFDAVVPVQADGRLQPLCGLYRVDSCREIVENILDDGNETPPLRTVFEKVRARKVFFDELKDLAGAEHFFVNVNTPDDLDKATAILDAHQPFMAK